MNGGFHIIDLVIFVLVMVFIFTRFFGKKLPKDKDKQENVVDFPSKTPVQATGSQAAREAREARKRAEQIDKLEGAEKIRAFDPSFSTKQFLAGAVDAYKTYYKAVEDEDEETLRSLLSPRLFDTVMTDIEDGDMDVMRVDEIEDAAVVDARAHGRTAIVDVKYDALMKKKGSRAKAKKVSTVWTWARNIDETDPNWELEDIKGLS